MIIDDEVVRKYIEGGGQEAIENHWVFDHIEEGKHLFSMPKERERPEVIEMLALMKEAIENFMPFNEKIYSSLYPGWKEIIKEVNVILVVGCPSPYDAMVMEHEGKSYVIFDLIRFHEYKVLGQDMRKITRQLITHETSHVCLQKRYPVPETGSFRDKLAHTVFDEGFAHLLAYQEDIRSYDFTSLYQAHHGANDLKLKAAFKERDEKKQKALLLRASSGPYWEKFGAVSGKLFLAAHLEELKDLYEGGVEHLIMRMDHQKL